MKNKNKRVLWLLNHTTLREFEVPLLRSLGYEVYTPKVFFMEDSNSSVDYQFDTSLTIPESALEALNNHDFYSQTMNSSIRAILNNYFFAAFPGFFPKMIHELVKHFNGQILMRTFGQLEAITYTGLISKCMPPGFVKDMYKVQDRLWFAQAYTNLTEVESPFLEDRAIFLPRGLHYSNSKDEDQWVGSNQSVLFVCPKVNAAPEYYDKVHREFVKDFGDLPHILADGQFNPVLIPTISGFQPKQVFDECLKACKVMYYQLQEPRYLDYHPLEAVRVGMPLVYMRGGLLEKFGGDNQPGACYTVAEARKKIKRILNGDQSFIEEIRCAQKKLLETVSFDYCQKHWQENFVDRFNKVQVAVPDNRSLHTQRKIAIFLPIAYRGGSLSAAKNMAKMLHAGSRFNDEPVTIIFSCVAGAYNLKEDFADLISEGIQIRETTWKRIATSDIASVPFLKHANLDCSHEYHQYPDDNIANFEDCDFWLLISDRTEDPLVTLKSYGVVIYDYIQRYVPELFGNYYESSFISTARRAEFVLTTTPQTRDDVIQYAGVSPGDVYLLPMEFNAHNYSLDDSSVEFPEANFFIWPTNCSIHKNHLVALEALEYYYKVLNGTFSIFLTDPSGFFTESLSKLPGKYYQSVLYKMNNSEILKKYVQIAGYLEQKEYLSVVARAKFMWHPTRKDNGTYSVIEAAYEGVPALSADYPQMRYIDNRFGLNMQFCDANDPINMAEGLKQMEDFHQKRARMLPDKEHLEQFGYHRLASDVWRAMKELI